MQNSNSTAQKTGLLSDFLTRQELASELGIVPRTLDRWKNERKGPPMVRLAGRVMYRRSAVERWLESLREGVAA